MSKKRQRRYAIATCIALACAFGFNAPASSQDWAAWVQGIGTILAIVGAMHVGQKANEHSEAIVASQNVARAIEQFAPALAHLQEIETATVLFCDQLAEVDVFNAARNVDEKRLMFALDEFAEIKPRTFPTPPSVRSMLYLHAHCIDIREVAEDAILQMGMARANAMHACAERLAALAGTVAANREVLRSELVSHATAAYTAKLTPDDA